MKKNNSKQQLDEMENRWKRALADYQNLQNRYEREKTDFVAFASSSLVLKLLTVLDHFKMAQQNLNDPGLEIAIKELFRVLSEEGLEKLELVNQVFDPSTMEAVELVDGDKDKIVGVITDGYTLKGKLLRPAKVQVGKG